MNELNPTNAFGELILDLIEAQFSGDFDAGISAIIETTGLSEEEVVSIIQGDTIIEDANLLSAIVDAFPDADDNDLEVIINVASSVDEEDRAALIDEIEMDEEASMQNEGMEEQPEMEEAMYGYNARTANFAQNQLLNKVQQLENKLASFEYGAAYNDRLKQLNNLADNYVNAGALPPSYKAMLVGNFSDDNQRLARFSQIAEENGVDVNTMLFATQYALGMLTDASDFVEFKDYSITDEDAAVAKFSANLDQQVMADIEAIFNN